MNLQKVDGNNKTGNVGLEIGILILAACIFSTFSIGQAASNGWMITGGGKLFSQAFIRSGGPYVITYLNQESIYLSFLSVLFSFLGNKEAIVSFMNFILQIAGIFFFYLGTRRLFSNMFPLALAFVSGLLSIRFFPVVEDSSMHMVWGLTGIIFWMGSFALKKGRGIVIKRMILGILLGICCYIDMVGFFLLLTFFVSILFSKDTPVHDIKNIVVYYLNYILSAVYGFFVMFYLWNNFLFNQEVVQYWLKDKIQYLEMQSGLNQYSCLAVLLFLIAVFYVLKSPAAETEYVAFEAVALEQIVVEETVGCGSLEKSESETQDDIVSEQESVKTIKFIENPLPLPKKHVKKEMNYAFEPTSDQMHYDYNNYTLDDDYDLKDI